MFEYGALFGTSFSDEFSTNFAYVKNWLSHVHPLWFVAGIVIFLLLVRLMTDKKVK